MEEAEQDIEGEANEEEAGEEKQDAAEGGSGQAAQAE
jgi:hypothetical protein